MVWIETLGDALEWQTLVFGEFDDVVERFADDGTFDPLVDDVDALEYPLVDQLLLLVRSGTVSALQPGHDSQRFGERFGGGAQVGRELLPNALGCRAFSS